MSAAACARLNTASARGTSLDSIPRAVAVRTVAPGMKTHARQALGNAITLRVERPGLRWTQVEFREQRQRDRERVETRAEVRARRGHPYLHADASARRTASVVASTSSKAPASERAASGSLSPLPVST